MAGVIGRCRRRLVRSFGSFSGLSTRRVDNPLRRKKQGPTMSGLVYTGGVSAVRSVGTDASSLSHSLFLLSALNSRQTGMNAGTFVPLFVSLKVSFTFCPILMSSRSPQSTMFVITLMPSSSVT